MFFIHRKSWIVRSALLLILLGGILGTLPVQAANATKQTVFAQTQVETALLVKDINPGAASSGYSSFENLNGILYFGATDGTVGEELWKSDGTSEGTVLVKDIKPGASGSLLRYFENVNGTLYFSADDGLHGHELWKSDGTEEGTVLVKDINPSTSSSIGNSSSHSLTNVNGILYFAVNDSINGIELWKSDGTEEGTVLVRDINPGTSSSNPENLVDLNGTLFFTATVGSYDTELWKSDGTPDGTVRVKDIFPGSVGSDPYNLTNVNGTLYFVAAGDLNGYNDYELWRSDGTSDGTILIKDIAPGVDPSYPDDLESLNGTLYFFAFDGVHGYELWKSNGTTSGTVMVKDILVGAQGAVGNLTVLGNTLYFSANDAIKGAELWKSNGTAAGTVMVKDIAAGSASSMPRDFGSVDGILYFAANDGNSGYELWKSDGTASGTMFVRDINPAGDSWPEQFIDVNGTLYFNATDGVHGYELWKIGWGDPPPPTSTPSLTPSPTFTSTSTATRTPTATSMYTPTMISSGDTKRASVGSDGAQGNNDSYFPAIATDGRYIVFNSRASNLVPGDTNGVSDIFLHDMQTSMTTRVSVDSNGVQGNGNSYHPVVTADGRYIAFDSDASNLVAGDTNGTKDIFLHDRQTGVSTRVSVDSNGTQGNGMSSFPAISEDGSFIVFHSNAMNLVTDDTNLVSDVFLHVREMGQTRRISTAFNGEQTSNDSFYPSVSADGRFIAFESGATNIVSGDTNGVTDIFLYDGLTTETVRVSRNSSGSQANNGSGDPSISANGRFVAFESDATNLVSGDTNAVTDVFLYDGWTGTTTRVSVGLDNLQGNSTSLAPSISADGRHITFDSYASNLVPGDGNAQRDAFVHDFGLRKTTRISVNSTNGEGNGQSAEIVVSADGEFLAFTSLATNLVADDTNSRADVFVRRQSVPFLPPTSTPTATRTATPSRTPTATFTRTPTPTPSLFQPYVNFDVGDGRAVTVGDFNNDGRQDVAMTNAMATTSQLFVFLQQSDGKLATPVSYDAGYQPHSLAVGDFNNDGRQDIVTTNMPSNEISVFLQQADGTLAPRVTFPTGTGKLAVAAGDLNSDGLTDIAVAGSDLGVFTQNAGGTLNPMVSYPSSNTGTAYNDIAIGDIDNDGKNDVIKKHGSPMFLVYLQTENGNLTPGLGYSIQNCQTFCSIEAIDTGDVTGDGLTDIVMTYGGNRPTSKVAVFAQAQDGSLKPAVSYDTYDIPVSVEVADVNQDTLADVLVAHSSWTKISTALQQAVGTLSPYVLHSVPYSSYAAYSMAVGDINHDDLPDIAIADYNNGLVILYHSPSSVPNPPTPTRVPVNTPTITPSPTSTLTNTPAASSTPISSCDAVNHGALTFSGNTMHLGITNPTDIPLAVQDVYVIWDHDKGHLVGNDKTLILQDASLNGASFWSGNDDGPILTITPLDLFIPPGTSTIVFTFHQTYEISDGSEELLISLATNGCQSYPIHAEYEPPTATPTNTFTPTVTPPYSYQPLYLSFTGSQTIGGVSSADEDILRFNGQNWSLFFDGSDVGVGSPDLSAFSILDADTILMSFSANVTVNGITATPQDVLRFDATSLGSVTAGTFSMSFDGSDVSFDDATNEKIDSLKLLPDGRLLISTTGNPAVPGLTGSRDEDVLAFTPTSLGTTTSGTWSMYFDGSDVGLSETSGEDIDALDVVGSNIYLSSQDGFSVNGVSGEDDDVFVCIATSTGDTTGCNYSPSLYFDGSTWGLTSNDIDGFNFLTPGSIPTAVPTNTPTRTPTATTTRTPTLTSTIGPSPTFTPTATASRTPTSGAGTTVTFIAVADARVSQASPSTNYGTATTLQADGGSGTAQTSFFLFNAGGMTGPILSAKLRVFCTTNGTANGPAAYLAYNNWHEYNAGGVTWDTQPPLLSGPFDNKGAIAANSWVEYDVTALMTTNGTYSFALVADSSDGVVFSSREGTMPPQLVVTFGSGPSTSTPTPTATNPSSITNTPTWTPTPTTAAPTPTVTATQTIVSPDTPTATQTVAASLLTFTPSADAYVDANNPANNYGALATLRVDASPVIRSYLRFDIQGLNGTVTRATLRVYANSASSQGCTASGVSDNTWTESTVNYNNAPPLGSALGASGSFGTGAWISIDVTAYITGNGAYNLALTTPGSTAVSLASREAGANAPQLIIETTP